MARGSQDIPSLSVTGIMKKTLCQTLWILSSLQTLDPISDLVQPSVCSTWEVLPLGAQCDLHELAQSRARVHCTGGA